MNRSLLSRVLLALLFASLIFAILIAAPSIKTINSATAQQASPGQGTSNAPDSSVESDVTDVPATPGTARAAKLKTIEIVEEMEHPAPDLVGTDLRKEHTLIHLNGSIDGTFRSDNFLRDAAGRRAFEYDANAAKLLRELATDPKVSDAAKGDAEQALQKLLEADRKVSTEVLAATDVFGDQKPQAATDYIASAQQELSAADTKISSDRQVSAVGNYRRAWQNTNAAINVLWESVNPGGERLLPELEQRMGTNVEQADTDGDGLTDAQELVRTGTDPTKPDPLAADRDSDGLTNQQEMQAGTDPLKPDTDGEGLTDDFEVGEFNSDPTRQDTDSDDLTDDSEKRLGTDPRKANTDSEGRIDGFEDYTSKKLAEELGVSIEMNGRGDVARGVEFEGLGRDKVFQEAPGRVSGAVDITSEAPFYDAKIKIEFDPAQVPNNDPQNLKIMYWDEAARVFVPLDSQGVNAEEGYAWADTTHFTTFLLVYEPTWYAEWRKDMGDDFKRDPSDPEFKNLDIVLDIDSSGSMNWNDPSDLRKTAAKGFIDALLEGDRTAVVDFDSSATLSQPLTTDFIAAKNAVDSIDSNGGTDIGAGVDVSLNEIAENGDPDHLKSIIVLTDGEGDYDADLTQRAKDAEVVIYTVGLGSEVDEQLLRSIAEATDGAYYPVSSANQLPELFERIAQQDPNPEPGPDADGDGLSDELETGGFRGGNGVFVNTDPNDVDTDGDGFEDGEEAGELSYGPDGNYFTVPTNPAEEDPDGDSLSDFEETDIDTDPNNPDSDFDNLSDSTELAEDFDPNDRNPDGDSLDDAEELNADAIGSDPFHYNKVGRANLKDVGVGFVSGGLGKKLADLRVIDTETIRSFGYLRGWTISALQPLIPLDDVRDAMISAQQGDDESALRDLIGLIPTPAMQVPGVIEAIDTFASWSPNLKVDMARWVTTDWLIQSYETKVGEVIIAPAQSITLQALTQLGWGDEIKAALQQTMSEENAEQAIKDMAASWNEPSVVLDSLENGSQYGEKLFDNNEWSAIEAAVNDPEKWDQDKLERTNGNGLEVNRSEARSVEATMKTLEDEGYQILYVGRNKSIELRDPDTGEEYKRRIKHDPDIVAIKGNSADPDELAIVEVKSSASESAKLSINNSRLKSSMTGGYYQPSWPWVTTRAQGRYLEKMRLATDSNENKKTAGSDINRAAELLEQVADRNDPRSYVAIIVGYGESGARLDDIDTAMKKISPETPEEENLGTEAVRVYTINVAD